MVRQIDLRPTDNVTSGPSFWDQLVGLGIMLVILGVIIFVIIFVIKWLLEKKERNRDIYTQDYKKTIELCKIHKDYMYVNNNFHNKEKGAVRNGP